MSYCKEFLKTFRKTVGAKPEEKIDKRYSGWLAPNNKTYGNAHCGYCAEVEYLSDIYDKQEKKKDEKRKDKIHKLVDEILKRIGKIEELADVWEIESIRDTILEAF